MNPNRDDVNAVLKQDLTDFVLFFLLEKYLSSFKSEHIPLIADAIANGWKKRIQASEAMINSTNEMALMRDILGGNIQFKEAKKESDKVLHEEIERLSNLIRNIGAESQFERRIIEQSLNPEIIKKPLRKPANEKHHKPPTDQEA